MSGPYNQGGYGGYPNQAQYGGDYSNSNSYPQQQQPQYNQGYESQSFAPPARQDSFGPPSHGGFQQGIQGHQYGNYGASNPQGHSDYYGAPQSQQTQQPTYGGHPQYDNSQYQQQQQSYGGQPQQQYGQGQQQDSYAANQAYQQSMSQGGAPTGAQPGAADHQFAKQSTDPNAPNYDPSAPPMTESDRGLLGALGGGFAGHHFGKKNSHGLLGTIGGAIAGSFAEDFMKKKKHGGGGSSWGGKF